MSNHASRNSSFSTTRKRALQTNEEIRENGLAWRKLSDEDGVWRYDIRVGGQRQKGVIGRERRDGITLSQAREYLEDIRAEARLRPADAADGDAAAPLFSNVAARYLEWSRAHHADHPHYASRMERYLLPVFGDQAIDEISVADIEQFRTELINRGLAQATINWLIALLSGVFEHARKSDDNLHNPTRRIATLRPQPTDFAVFSDADLRALMEDGCKSTSEQALIGLAAYAGLRASEVLGLEWRHIDFGASTVHVVQTAKTGVIHKATKSGHRRSTVLPERLATILHRLSEELQDAGINSLVFPGTTHGTPLYQVQHIFDRIKRRAGLAGAPTYHALRHTFATNALDRAIPPHKLQYLMGHSSIEVTMGYVHYKGADIATLSETL